MDEIRQHTSSTSSTKPTSPASDPSSSASVMLAWATWGEGRPWGVSTRPTSRPASWATCLTMSEYLTSLNARVLRPR